MLYILFLSNPESELSAHYLLIMKTSEFFLNLRKLKKEDRNLIKMLKKNSSDTDISDCSDFADFNSESELERLFEDIEGNKSEDEEENEDCMILSPKEKKGKLTLLIDYETSQKKRMI